MRLENKIYLRNSQAVEQSGLPRVRDDVLRRHESLVTRLIDFCRDRYKVTWSHDQAEAALLSYVQDYARPVLGAAFDGHPIPNPAQTVRHADFLVNSFAKHLYESQLDGFEYLETIVKGSMLANVLIFPQLDGVSRRFQHLSVFLDTRIVLRALGLSGESQRIASLELIDLLYKQNVSLMIFDHTLEEMYRILEAVAGALRIRRQLRRAYGEIMENAIDAGLRASDIEFVIARLPRLVADLRIEVKGRPGHTVPLVVNEARLEQILQEEVGYRREDAKKHDVDSLTSIHRLRQAGVRHQIETCDAVFVTTNTSLARAAALFFREEYETVTVPLCLLDQTMATIAWLKTPIAMPEFPRHRMVAACYAAMRPPDLLWRRYLEEIDSLQQRGNISEHDYNLLRFSTQARSALMEITFGEVDAFTEGTVTEVLEVARAAARADVEGALREETARRAEAEGRASEVEARTAGRQQALLLRIHGISSRVAGGIAYCCMGLGIAILLAGAYLTLPRSFPALPGRRWELLAPMLLVTLAGAGVVNIVWGITLRSLVRELEVVLTRAIEQGVKRILDL